MVGKMTLGELSDSVKGVVVVELKRGDEVAEPMFIGKFTKKETMPPKIENKEFVKLGFYRGGAKAGEKASELQSLTSNFFVQGAPTQNLFTDNEYSKIESHYIISSMDKLKELILSNMAKGKFETLKNPAVISATKKFFDSNCSQPFDWKSIDGIMSMADKRKFSIYLMSELAYPFLLWSGVAINGFPGFSKCRFFAVPSSSSNPAYDSVVIGYLKEGGKGKAMVSSKSEEGARPNALIILRNIAKSTDNYDMLQNKFLVSFLPYVKAAGEDKPGRKVVYPFGIYECLRISKSDIPDAVAFGSRLCSLSKGTLPESEMKTTQKEVNAVFAAIKKNQGVPLPNVNKTLPVGKFPNEAQKLLGGQQLNDTTWKEFGLYISFILCKAIDEGLNTNSADFNPPVSWQLNLKTDEFIETGTLTFVAKQGGVSKKVIFDSSKETPKAACRGRVWLGMRPL